MKTLTSTKLFLAALSFLVCLSGFNVAFGATISLTSPNGGETWTAGTTNAITWTSDVTTNLRIVLLKNGVQIAVIAGAIPNTGSFNWAIPAAIISGTDYTVKISSCLAPAVFDVSDANFTISGGSGSTITVVTPNGGESWTAGTTNTIAWTSDVTGNVRISLLKNGAQYSLIAASVPNTGTFNWLIPVGLLAGAEYKVKVSSALYPLINDMSDANFSISAGIIGTFVTVTSPNGGETLTAGTANTITWTSDVTGYLRILLLKNGLQYAVIARALPNTGSYNWMIPATMSNGADYTVQISSCINPLISDVSDASFTIAGGSGSTIVVVSPNGGESWTAGTANTITWTSDVTGNVRISLLKNGAQYSLIAASVPNTGSFNWLIPARLLASTEYKVKISSAVNPLISDMSDANFSINAGIIGTFVTVTSPNGGETWTAGTANTITWTSDVTGYLRILLLKNGLQYAVIARALPNTGSYSWMIPATMTNGADYTVQISSCINPLISDVSDASFTIAGGSGSTIAVVSPNGGESWTAGTTNTVTWTSDVTGNVRISLLKNGAPYSLIAASVPNTGAFNWLIPGGLAAGADYKVKITSSVNPLITDMSDADFTIIAGSVGTFLTVTSPNGGETLTVGSTHVITWTSDVTSNLRIVLLKNGIQYAVIAGALPNSGSFNWLIPATIIAGTDYTVKVSCCLNPVLSDVSDGPFSIIIAGDNSDLKTIADEQENDNVEVKIYPNPATDIININADRNIDNIKILNSVGQIVSNNDANASQVQLYVDGYKSGIYFIRIETGTTTTTRKVMIN